MADVKISALGSISAVAGEDLVAIVDDPSGTPASRKATITQLATFINASGITASSTATLTNKTIDAEGTGNSITNIDVANLKSGVLDTDLSSVSGSDDTIASAKAVKAYVDAQILTEDTLSELNDTTISSVGDNELLQYDSSSSKWINQTLAEAGISPVAGSSSIVTTGTIGTGTWQGTAIASTYIAADAIVGSKIADNAIDSEHITNGSVDLAHMSVNSIDSDQYVDASIDLAHLSADSVNGTKIADDSIDSEHIADGSIDNAHVATGLDAVKLADGSVTNAELQYINTLSSNAQTQINAKSPTAGNTSLTTVGTIGTGVWNATVIPSAKLDADTAHLSTTQTFSGAKTFSANVDVAGNNIDNIQNLVHDISSGSLAIDFSGDQLQTLTITSNSTFSTSNRATGKSKTYKLYNSSGSSTYTFTFPAWKFVGAKPTEIAASKVGILTLTCFGTADTDIVAAYAVEE
jgi:hypothetical protein